MCLLYVVDNVVNHVVNYFVDHNFKAKLLLIPNTELAHFLCDSVCVSTAWLNIWSTMWSTNKIGGILFIRWTLTLRLLYIYRGGIFIKACAKFYLNKLNNF